MPPPPHIHTLLHIHYILYTTHLTHCSLRIPQTDDSFKNTPHCSPYTLHTIHPTHCTLHPLRVTAVGADEISIQNKATKETEKRPYGVCVWSTGLAPLPITTTIIQRVTGQNKGSVQFYSQVFQFLIYKLVHVIFLFSMHKTVWACQSHTLFNWRACGI